MSFRNLAYVVLLLAFASIGVYWWKTRPTIQETTLKSFFAQFRRGNYTAAQEYSVGNDFYTMAASTKVRDTDGSQYLIGEFFPPSRREFLQFAVETYTRPYIAKWRYLGMKTQKLTETKSVVSFRIELGIWDYPPGSMASRVYEGTVEGIANMVLMEGKWKIENFELNLFSDEGLTLKPYLTEE